MSRTRLCVECPKCRTHYVLGFSPYDNGAFLMSVGGRSEEYILYCSCGRPPNVSHWQAADLQLCIVAKRAYERGYGAADDIRPVAANRRPLARDQARSDHESENPR